VISPVAVSVQTRTAKASGHWTYFVVHRCAAWLFWTNCQLTLPWDYCLLARQPGAIQMLDQSINLSSHMQVFRPLIRNLLKLWK
jgi:hypothetical protein